MNCIFDRITSKYLRLGALVILPGILIPSAYGQTVSGTVTESDGGYTLPGATVTVVDASGDHVAGVATDLDGAYSLDVAATGSFSVIARFVGFQEAEQSVTLSSGQSLTVDFALGQTGFELNTVVVAASRRQEKALDAPASISVLNSDDVEGSVSTSSIDALRTTTGVDMAQTGVDRREVVLRGFNNAFSGAAYVLTDYRQAAAPSLAVNLYSIMPIMNIDVDRIEVVRGPGSALYGAGVDAGVIHFISKDPFTHPGTTISVSGGERSLFGAQFRHAGVTGTKKNIGYKITGMYGQAKDWELDPDNPEDAIQIKQDRLTPGTASVRDNGYDKFNLNGTLEYRFGPNRALIVNGGHSEFTASVLSGIGTVQGDGFGYSYGQLRLKLDNFFAQVYVNKNSAGNSFVYGLDIEPVGGDLKHDIVVDKGVLYNAQAQYDATFADGRQSFIFGVDLELTRPDTEGTINGRNEDDDDISEYGAYVQSTTRLTNRLNLTIAARGDYNNVQENLTISPRAALVFSPGPGHSFRVTYNRAFSSPTSNSNFLDIVAGVVPGSDILIRGRGSGSGFSWERNPAFEAIAGTDLVATSLNPAALGVPTPAGLPLDATYASLYAGLAAIPTAQLTAVLNQNGIPVNDGQTAALVGLLSPAGGTNVNGFSRGILGVLNLTTLEPVFVNDLQAIAPLKSAIAETIELGYKGLINNKILVAVDAYYTQKKDFIGPLIMETPFVFVPNLSNDLTAAVADGIEGNAQLAGTLGLFGVSPEAAAGLIVGLAGSALPDSSTPVAIVQPLENNPGLGKTPELMLSYRNFGKVDFYGVDASVQVMVSDELNIFGNVSFVSDDFFSAKELDEEGTDRKLALNAPAKKFRAGFEYTMPSGFSFNAAGRYSDEFPILSGPYEGILKSYFLLDVGVGYDLNQYAPGLRIDIGVSNVTDDLHREFIGAPQLGRMAIARVTYSVR
ncbi:MAG: hypothetical protein BMS9Abin05_1157 [Rhodothermia bacterium]|nr:MAG: hypothetical protein BMS9Abin05_1157 [Rhodothermia bacterium]